ncbi:MAG: lysoplasmalogenase [Nocardioidaceae bacterium]
MRTALPWILPAVLAVVDWVAVARDDRRTETWAKPTTLLALIGVTWLQGDLGSTAHVWLLVALVFGLLGDVLLLGDSTARFQAGLGAFLVGHLAFVVCFAVLGLDRPAWALVGLVVVLVALGWARGVLPATHRSDGPALSVPVGVYMAVISAMAVTAWATGEWLIGLGATVFVASDAMLAVNRFVRPLPGARVLIMVTYHVGQALMAIGVLTVPVARVVTRS